MVGNAVCGNIWRARFGNAAGSCVAHLEAVLHECDSETGAGAVFCCVAGVEEVGEEEADELEGHGDEGVPDEGEEGSD